MSAYRSHDVDDPRGFVANAVAVLQRYPETVVEEVCRPGYGIQTRIKWPPSQAELREACERVAGERANRERRALLNKHRVLLDTPQGLKPEAEATRLLTGPNAPCARTAEEREAIVAKRLAELQATAPVLTDKMERWGKEARAAHEALETPAERLKRLAAQSGVVLTDADIARLPSSASRWRSLGTEADAQRYGHLEAAE
jgi:hypothetical protein